MELTLRAGCWTKFFTYKMFAKKKYFLLIGYTWYTNRARFYLSLPICVTLPIFTVHAFIFLTLTPDYSILFTAVPQLTNSATHCIEYTALLKILYSHFW
jgi:hypothetical protein